MIDFLLMTMFFDVVINRHEAFNAEEVQRILRTGGYFITQQVGGSNNNDLSHRLIDDFQPSWPYWDLAYARNEVEQAGMEVLYCDEIHPKQRFFDVGALVYFAKVIEWEFPGFSVDNCFDKLVAIHEIYKEQGYIESTEHRFIFVCRNDFLTHSTE